MPEKCEKCGGLGMLLAGTMVWRCNACKRFTLDAARAHIRLCCEAHDELVELCKSSLDILTEPGLMDVDKWKAWKKEHECRLRGVIAKAQPSQEAGK